MKIFQIQQMILYDFNLWYKWSKINDKEEMCD